MDEKELKKHEERLHEEHHEHKHDEKHHEKHHDKHHEHKHHDCKCHEKHHECECKEHECKCHEEKPHEKHHEHKHPEPPHEKRIRELEAHIHELEEKNLRTSAEMINFRKRKEEEVTRLLKYSNEGLVKELLPVLDNFERAIDMDDDNLEDEVSKFLQGFKMVYCNFVNILNNYEIKEIESLNKPFDPTYHQAVMTEKRDGVEPGIVIEVMQKGYMLKDKVIRPAMVKVSE